MDKLIYLIEDDHFMRCALERHIRTLKNIKLISFEDPIELIKATITNPPEILLLDFKIKQNNRNYLADEIIYNFNRIELQIPIVVFSALNSQSLRINLHNQGVFEFISKNDDDFLIQIKQSILRILDWVNKSKSRELIKIYPWQNN